MRIRNALLVLALLLISFRAQANPTITPELVHNVVLDGPAVRDSSIRALREAGYRGLDALFITFGREISEKLANKDEPKNWDLIASAIDSVAGQKDAWASHLFWHTDLEAAKREARASNKTILSLRLLGRLDSDLSCANSRFFRTVLYSDPNIASLLRDRFVLHWQSVRPVPIVTIDFGDGRVLKQTVTGNSIHYALDSDGNVIDGLPGMNSPAAFLNWLGAMSSRSSQLNHAQLSNNIRAEWTDDLIKVGLIELPYAQAKPDAKAAEAGRLSRSKTSYEAVVLRFVAPDPELLEATAADRGWERLAALHPENKSISDRSLALIRTKFADEISDESIEKAIERLRDDVALDTIRNRYAMKAKLHDMLALWKLDLDSFNDRVYTELFATPPSDPWLGLSPDNIFGAIDENGRIEVIAGVD